MKILIVSATPFEIAPLLGWLREHFWPHSEYHFQRETLEVQILVTGVGSTFTAFSLGQTLAGQPFHWVINAGIAGAFQRSLRIGEVVNVVQERFADLGVEEADGSFTDLHELGLLPPDQPPFQNGCLLNPAGSEFSFLPTCKGLTVNKVHGHQPSIDAISKKYEADVESMEGAAVFLACLHFGVPFLEIRAISNYVEPRNREAWDLPLAIEQLNLVLVEFMSKISG